MTTTTGDPSSLKTPAGLSGGDLVSRLLAATPPYLYNVPLTPHSFFFSEMLRSFVQTKAEAGTSSTTSNPIPSVARRRKRSWRDARDRPLELTTKDKTTHHHHHHHNPLQHPHHHHHNHHHHNQQTQQQKDKYYPIQQQQQQQQQQQLQQQQQQQETHVENKFKTQQSVASDSTGYTSESSVKRATSYEQKSTAYSMAESLKTVDDNRSDFCKQSRDFYDDSSRRFSSEQSAHQEALFAAASQKIKPEEPAQQQTNGGETKNFDYTTVERNNAIEERAKIANQELSFLNDQKNKLHELAGRNFLPGMTGNLPRLDEQQAKGFGLSGVNVPSGTDFLPSGSLWYPPPYPTIAQSYPAIDPLHFFIDLRVSGHIWDRKMNERQSPFKSKHCSAFSVPQAKEYNRPLDLTRDEASSSSTSSRNNPPGTSNQRGTHFILRNLTETYKEIREMEKNSNNRAESTTSSKSSSSDETSGKDYPGRSLPKSATSPCPSSSSSSSTREHRQQKDEENEGKDLRALIGLELVVDYVKEPKEDTTVDEEQSPDVVTE